MAIEVPASMNKFLQIRTLAFIDFALGLVSFVFEVRRLDIILKEKYYKTTLTFSGCTFS
jgi:hypothetical protein